MRKEIIREGFADYFNPSNFEIQEKIPIEIVEGYAESAVRNNCNYGSNLVYIN